MREVPATEAKTHLAQLPSSVERGETIAIIRHGRLIAHLVPAEAQERAARRAAVERFEAQRTKVEGRRHVHRGAHRRPPRGAPILSAFVLDASVAITWLLDDELNPLADAALARAAEAEGLPLVAAS